MGWSVRWGKVGYGDVLEDVGERHGVGCCGAVVFCVIVRSAVELGMYARAYL